MRLTMLNRSVLSACLFATSVGLVIADQPIDLLAGGTLDAWRGYNQDAVPEGWRLVDGTLTRTEQSADLITREKFGDFDFSFEWKIAEGGNSGVLYRVSETPQASYFTGPEYQVLDNKGWKLKPTDRTAAGALYAMYPPATDASKPAGEWNTGRIVIKEGAVEHWLNGQKVVDAQWGSDDWIQRIAKSKFASWKGFAKNPQGHIALQDHGAEVSYRNLKITRLDEAPVKTNTSDRPVRMLLVTQSGGFRHSTVTRKPHELSHTERVMKQLGVESGDFRVDCTQDVEQDFKPELIENYDVVMFYTTGKMFDDAKRLPIDKETLDWFLEEWLTQAGHGFLGVHAAADTFEDYKPYWDMIGGSFDGHPWTSNATVTISVHDPSHPAMQPWPNEFVITDEIYQFKNWQPEKVRVLMSLNMAKTDLKKPYHVPVCWVKQYGEGRVMHMSMGHREDVWTNPMYQQSLLHGVRWLVGKEPGDATPNPGLSAEQEELAKQAAQ